MGSLGILRSRQEKELIQQAFRDVSSWLAQGAGIIDHWHTPGSALTHTTRPPGAANEISSKFPRQLKGWMTPTPPAIWPSLPSSGSFSAASSSIGGMCSAVPLETV